MSGLVFSHIALQQIVNRAHPAAELEQHPQAAALGALGSLLLRYAPHKDPKYYDEAEVKNTLASGTPSEQFGLQDKLLMISYGAIIKRIQPVIGTLEQLVPLLQKLRDAAQAEDADKARQLGDQINAIDLTFLSSSDGGIQKAVDALKELVVKQIAVAYRPMLQTQLTPATIEGLVKRPEMWRRYERLRWQRSGQFLERLMARSTGAAAAVRPSVRAYVLGYRSHWATAVTSSSFIANIVGGPYRSHWWRSLWVQHAVDAWTHGFFNRARIGGAQPTMSGSEPVPPYSSWATLQNARHDQAFDVGTGQTGLASWTRLLAGNPGTSAELQAIAATFTAAWNDVYPPNSNPLLDRINPPNLGPMQESEFLEAFNGLIAVMYLLTGDHPLISYWMTTIAPPKKLFPPPAIGGGSGGGGPIAPSFPSYSPSAVGILAAIAALLAFLLGCITGGIVLGVIAVIAEIINLVSTGADASEKFKELDSNIYHIQLQLQQVSLAFQDALWTAGLGFPRADQLGTLGPSGVTQHLEDRSKAAVYGDPVARKMFITERSRQYPWRTNETPAPDGQFDRYPGYSGAAGQETGTGLAADWPEAGFFPDVALAGRAGLWGLSGGGAIVQPVQFPFRRTSPSPTAGPVFFGNAVANGILAIGQPDSATFTDFNLDADRGYGWRCWEVPQPAGVPASGNVTAAPST